MKENQKALLQNFCNIVNEALEKMGLPVEEVYCSFNEEDTNKFIVSTANKTISIYFDNDLKPNFFESCGDVEWLKYEYEETE